LPCVFPSELRYLSLELEDPDREFNKRIPAAIEFINEGRTIGAVLVHCGAGVSRSAAVVLSYLCHLGRPMHEACAELSRAVLTGIDESFLSQVAAAQGVTLSKQQLQSLSLLLAGHGETAVG
jgi:protein-tyrosine phosphatase